MDRSSVFGRAGRASLAKTVGRAMPQASPITLIAKPIAKASRRKTIAKFCDQPSEIA
jgi:hypothetical protein